MKISILGAGDRTKITRFTNMSEQELDKIIEDSVNFFLHGTHELVIIPNKGIPLEIAKKYKEKGQPYVKVHGVIPTNDKIYGNNHIKEFINFCDEKISCDSWYDADGIIASQGVWCIVYGMSPGVMRALTALKFHQKYLKNKTKLIIFENTISQKLPKEIEEEIPIKYINSVDDLNYYDLQTNSF